MQSSVLCGVRVNMMERRPLVAIERKATDRIHDRAPPTRSGFQTLQYNPGGWWSGGGTGGGTEGQVHVEMERLGIEAEREARTETMELEPTRAEQTELEPTRAERTGLEPTRAERTGLEPTSAEETGQKTSTAELKTTRPEQKEQKTTRPEQKTTEQSRRTWGPRQGLEPREHWDKRNRQSIFGPKSPGRDTKTSSIVSRADSS